MPLVQIKNILEAFTTASGERNIVLGQGGN